MKQVPRVLKVQATRMSKSLLWIIVGCLLQWKIFRTHNDT